MENEFKFFINFASILKDVMKEDIAVTVMDKSTILYYRAGDTIDLYFKIGDAGKGLSVVVGEIKKTITNEW